MIAAGSRSSPKTRLEICVGSIEHAVRAERAGADRIELCSNLAAGGTTPTGELMECVRATVRIPLHVMIRPREGNFLYSAEEFSTMRENIRLAKRCKADGVVLGILDKNADVDVRRTRELVEFARPLQVTFHRAFDECGDLGAALEAVIATGAGRLLTSGGVRSALEGIGSLERLARQAGERVIIMPGAGIIAANVQRLIRTTHFHEVHASLGLASESVPDSGGLERLNRWERDVRSLREAIDLA